MEIVIAVARSPFAKRMDPARGCGSTPPFSAEENLMSSSSESVIVEVRAAEGGADAKLLVLDQVKIYLRLCARRSL